MSIIERTAMHTYIVHIPCLFSSTQPLCVGPMSLLFCLQQLFTMDNYDSKWHQDAIWTNVINKACATLVYKLWQFFQ